MRERGGGGEQGSGEIKESKNPALHLTPGPWILYSVQAHLNLAAHPPLKGRPKRGITMLDVGCGSGRALIKIDRHSGKNSYQLLAEANN